MQTTRIPLEQMKPAPYNPRVKLEPGDPIYESLKVSIQEFGCVEPLVWNRRTGYIVGGHQRYDVLLDLGYTEDDVIVVDLDELKEKELNLRRNKITGRWENDKLAEILAELEREIDLTLAGFDEMEVSRILQNANLDIDSFFTEKQEEEESEGEEYKGEVQCPECGCWFKPKK